MDLLARRLARVACYTLPAARGRAAALRVHLASEFTWRRAGSALMRALHLPSAPLRAVSVAPPRATGTPTRTAEASDAEPGSDDSVELAFPDVGSFVREFLAPSFGRPLDADRRWCPRWFEHTEAVLRLEALWRSFEFLRLDPNTGIAVWLRDHLDHQLPQLTSATGPSARCGSGHRPDAEFPVQDPPLDWRAG